MSNPVITSVDTKTVFKSDLVFVDRSVEVPALTTLAVGTVLGILTASGQTNRGAMGGFNSGLSSGVEVPVAVLAEELINDGSVAEKKDNVRVCAKGVVDGASLVFVNSSDDLEDLLSGTKIKDALLAKGIIVESYKEQTYLDNGAV
jgi:hypothetical protein